MTSWGPLYFPLLVYHSFDYEGLEMLKPVTSHCLLLGYKDMVKGMRHFHLRKLHG